MTASSSALPRSQRADKLYYGVYPAMVRQVGDPQRPGEVRLVFPWFDPGMETEWCRVCNLYAGNGYGSFFHPEEGDEVLVAFILGDMRQPIVLGGLYNGQDKPPTTRSSSKDEKMFRTKAGHQITLDDTDGAQKVVIVDKTGNNKIVIDSVANSIAITSSGKLTLTGQGIEIKSSAGIKIEASATMDLKGSTINLN